MHVRNDLKCLLKSGIIVNNKECKNIFIEIVNQPSKKQKIMLIGIAYRHARVNFTSFQNKLCETNASS